MAALYPDLPEEDLVRLGGDLARGSALGSARMEPSTSSQRPSILRMIEIQPSFLRRFDKDARQLITKQQAAEARVDSVMLRDDGTAFHEALQALVLAREARIKKTGNNAIEARSPRIAEALATLKSIDKWLGKLPAPVSKTGGQAEKDFLTACDGVLNILLEEKATLKRFKSLRWPDLSEERGADLRSVGETYDEIVAYGETTFLPPLKAQRPPMGRAGSSLSIRD